METLPDSFLEDHNSDTSPSYGDSNISPNSQVLYTVFQRPAPSYAMSESSCTIDAQYRRGNGPRDNRRHRPMRVDELAKEVRQMDATLKARDMDARANLQIIHENTASDSQQVMKTTLKLENAVKAIPQEVRDTKEDIQKAMAALQLNMEDTVAQNNTVIMHELHEIKSRFEASALINRDTAEFLLAQRDLAQHKADNLEKENWRLSEELTKAQDHFESHSHIQRKVHDDILQEVVQLREALKRKTSELGAAEELLSAARTGNEPGQLARGDKVCDKDFLEKWNALAYEIRNVALVLSQTKRSQVVHPGMPYLQSQAEKYLMVLEDENCETDVLQTLIWRTITHDVLYGWSVTLDFHPQRMLQFIKQNSMSSLLGNEVVAKKLGGWISDGTYYLAPAIDNATHADTLQSVSHEISSDLIKMVDDKEKNEAACQIHPMVQDICAMAIELQMMMLRSKSYFSVEWIEPMLNAQSPVLFNKDTMECSLSGGQLEYVLWGLTPVLWKHGNADGHDYGEPSVLAKAQVMG